LFTIAWVRFLSPAQGHPLGFSGLRVEVQPQTIHAAMTLHTRDLGTWFPPAKYPDYVKDVCDAIAKQANDVVEVQVDAQPIKVKSVKASSPEVGMIELDIDYALPSSGKTMLVWSKCLPQLPIGHQQLLVVDDARGGKPETLLDDTLAPDHDSVEVDIPNAVATSSTQPATAPVHLASNAHSRGISFVLLGINHIITGYDHLLFLAALLLVCNTFGEAASVITFFTIAHSITLTAATLDLVRLPARIVEPAIAASIVYVGLENIFGKHKFAWRAAITFGFGLVHGLGFASALREVGLGSTSVGIVMPLIKFSIGLETGQLCIAAVILKILLTLRKTQPDFKRQWVPAGSMLVSVIGAYWLIVRVMAG
jgi:hydrogenase/urease accessory protein HupE